LLLIQLVEGLVNGTKASIMLSSS